MMGEASASPAEAARVDGRAPLRWRDALLWGAGLMVILRIGLGVVMGIAWALVRPHIPAIWLDNPSLYGQLRMDVSPLGQFLLSVWPRWDATQHLNLAMRGYFDMGEGSTVFYPLYAALTRVAAFITGDYIVGGLVISSLAAALAFALLILVGNDLYGGDSGKWAAIALAAYPTSVFLIAPFSESLFLALTLGAFLAAYRMRWLATAALAALASLARAPGVAAPAAFALIGWDQWSSRKTGGPSPSLPAVLAAIVAPVVAGGAFLAWRSLAGFGPITAVLHKYVGTTVVDPVSGLMLAIQQWLGVFDLPTTLDLLSAAAFLAVTALMVAVPRWRRPELLVYMIVNLVILLGRYTEGAASLKSLSRYVLVLFPGFLIVGDWLASKSHRTRFWYVTVSSSLLLILATLYVFWFFIG